MRLTDNFKSILHHVHHSMQIVLSCIERVVYPKSSGKEVKPEECWTMLPVRVRLQENAALKDTFYSIVNVLKKNNKPPFRQSEQVKS